MAGELAEDGGGFGPLGNSTYLFIFQGIWSYYMTSTAPTDALPVHPLLGRTLALGAAVSFGVNTTLARLAYDSGSNTVTFVSLRIAIAVLAIGALMLFLRRPLGLTAAGLRTILPLAAMVSVMGLLYMGAVTFIPVGLAVLIFYTFPLIVAAVSPLTEGTPLGRRQGLIFLAAFAGLGLALGPSFDELDWRGIALAFAAAAAVATMLLVGGPASRRMPVLTLVFASNLLSLPLILIAAPFLGGFAAPQTATGWYAFAAASVAYVVAIVTQFTATRIGGTVGTALFLNFEPLVSISAAALLLGERLAPLQYAGAAFVLTALFASAALAGRRPSPAEPTR